jgi:hypothetical protein
MLPGGGGGGGGRCQVQGGVQHAQLGGIKCWLGVNGHRRSWSGNPLVQLAPAWQPGMIIRRAPPTHPPA